MISSPIIVALDYPTQEAALDMASQLDPKQCRVKVGKELFTLAGPAVVDALQSKGFEVFLDLKFHDIPNTTAMAVKEAAKLGVWMVNVHASGGRRMMENCRNELDKLGGTLPLLIGVTVLTSMDREDLREIGIDLEPQEHVLRLARLAEDSGLDGVVCSAQEATALRSVVADQFALVTPGIRPPTAEQGDQRRIMTPRQALDAGSNYLVIGRPITRAEVPNEALVDILASLD
ncbi:orotidine-5'-phosphate decarboxylase [Pokkaliibacter sp. CJK22405]|uniref:orotidine-5'-phosphate decarboxylase n=1 Tax=Pokkaliibacter sp. CJK22405 TaxID=3384615 RepID=UPI003984B33D